MGPFATVIYGSQNRKTGSWFLYNNHPWFHRGGGINGFGNAHGYIYDSLSFRVVLGF